eukprot:snap_masked-scaffold_37-processed-gene-1.12-mRNA-1 protein AED:1.00 eAED:1.00 QI:0/0/0/0/1/1/2/0/63
MHRSKKVLNNLISFHLASPITISYSTFDLRLKSPETDETLFLGSITRRILVSETNAIHLNIGR